MTTSESTQTRQRSRQRRRLASALIAVGVAGATAHAAAAPPPPPIDAETPPILPEPAPNETAQFPPGRWRGMSIITGAMSGSGVKVSTDRPLVVRFELEIAPDGAVIGGAWNMSGSMFATVPGGEGDFTLGGIGDVSGAGAYVTWSGPLALEGHVTTQGFEVPVALEVAAAGGFSPTTAECGYVSGDLATEIRSAQQAAGFSTTIAGPFTAHRISGPGDGYLPSFEDTYVEIVTSANNMLMSPTAPSAADVVSLVERAESFYVNVLDPARCDASDVHLLPGQMPYDYFMKTIGEVLLHALVDPSAYSASDLNTITLAAIRIGVIGQGAPDPEPAVAVEQLLGAALHSKLDQAVAANDTDSCTIIRIAALTLGLGTLATNAAACAAGG